MTKVETRGKKMSKKKDRNQARQFPFLTLPRNLPLSLE